MIYIYTGEGKGKTSAATGMVIRAKGAGFRSIVIRFIKKRKSSEDEVLEKLQIPVEYYGTGFIVNEIDSEMKDKAREGIRRASEILKEGEYDILVLDEIINAISCGVIREDTIIDLLNRVPESLEIVLTGRGATKRMIEMADLVTEMKEIKHYFKEGIKARKGIEF